MSRLHVAPRACSTCPYRRDTEPGIWDAAEYEKLVVYDQDPSRMEDPRPALTIFHCHQEAATGIPTICRGWLGVHRGTPAVRYACALGAIAFEQVPREAEPYLYASGTEACKAGLAGVRNPSREARREAAKLLLRAGRRGRTVNVGDKVKLNRKALKLPKEKRDRFKPGDRGTVEEVIGKLYVRVSIKKKGTLRCPRGWLDLL